MGPEVYIIEGWFGDCEWIEGVYAREKQANEACRILWQTRASDNGPDYARGLHKFAVIPHKVIT